MGGGTRTQTTQEARPSGDVAPLLAQTGVRAQQFQQAADLTPFIEAKPLKVAGLSESEKQALGRVQGGEIGALGRRRISGETLANDPAFAAAQSAYKTAIQPGVENAAAVAGLGRSTALTNALAQSQAQYLQPTIESALGREQTGLQNEQQLTLAEIQALLSGGGLERGIEQQGYEAQQADLLRRQALAEEALFGPLGQLLPSAIGQGSTTRGKSGVFTGG